MALVEITRDGGRLPVPDHPADPLTFSFFIPCYNEEKNVVNVVEKLATVAARLNAAYEILVFDDCSKDGTVQAVRNCQQARPDVPLRLFSNSTNQGVARNFIEGAFQGRGKHYRVVMGDDVESVETLEKILSQAGNADIIIPYHSQVTGRPFHRKVISRLYTVLVNIASKRKLRYYNGSPLFLRRDALRFHVEATGLGFQAEFLLRLLQEGRSFIEIPVVASDREGSTSLNLRNFVSVGYSIFKIYMRRLSGRDAA
ncbi:MAG: glycosyltransferase family 2 protein [Burkholderiales bacterium]|nr:glycosyltransferase family 2 protein [Burkholderiales bacterium]